MASPASLGHSRGWLDTTGGVLASRLVPRPPSGSDLAATETARLAAHESRHAYARVLLDVRDIFSGGRLRPTAVLRVSSRREASRASPSLFVKQNR